MEGIGSALHEKTVFHTPQASSCPPAEAEGAANPSVTDSAARQMLAENVWVNGVILAALAGELETARSNLTKVRKALQDSDYRSEIAGILGGETGQAP